MSGEDTLYRALLALLGLFAVGAVVVGGGGLFTVLTGGTTGGEIEVAVLGEFACEGSGSDPGAGIAHDPRYEVERTVLSGTEIESFEVEAAGDGHRFEARVAGELLGASARRADGTELPVGRDGNRLVVTTDGSAPFRLWIDNVAEEATVTRTRLDICPPE